MTEKRRNRIRLRRCDVAALFVCAAVFGFLLFCAPRGMGTPDESFYFTIPQRILSGDRLLVDEWQVSQLSALLQLLPYYLYTHIVGGTEGVVLFFRYLYIFCCFCVYWFLYCQMRRSTGVCAAAAAGLFALSAQNAIFTLNYYTMAIQGLAVCCALLFCGKRPAAAVRYIFAGFLFGCAVIAQPPLVLLWVVYAVYGFVSARKRRQSDGDDGRRVRDQFLSSMLGAGICALFLLLFLLKTSGLGNVVRTLPELFTDANHGFFTENGIFHVYSEKISSACMLYGTLWLSLAAAMCFLCVIYAALPKKYAAVRTALFILLCAAICGAFIHALIYRFSTAKATRSLSFHGFPLLFFGVGVFFLEKKKNAETAPFLFSGAVASLCVDLFSDITLGFGGALTLFYTLPAFLRIIRETYRTYRDNTGKRRKSALVSAVLTSVCVFSSLACFGGWQYVYCSFCVTPVYEQTMNLLQVMSKIPFDTKLSEKLERGPLKGTYTTFWLHKCYNETLDDIDRIKANCDGNFCNASPYAYIYLYAELPYGAYSAYYNESNAPERLERYWELFPEKKAQYLYFPRAYLVMKFPFPEEDVAQFAQRHECRTEKGKAGYIVEILE